MITKGKIVSIDGDNKLYGVRIPLLESAGISRAQVLQCTLCYDKGNINNLRIDDTVFVDFEDNKIESPVIIGSLYIGEDKATNYSLCQSLKVTDNAELPLNTKIGDSVTGKDLKLAIDYIKNEDRNDFQMPTIKLVSITDKNKTMKYSDDNQFIFRIACEGQLQVGDEICLSYYGYVCSKKANRSAYRMRNIKRITITQNDINNKYIDLIIEDKPLKGNSGTVKNTEISKMLKNNSKGSYRNNIKYIRLRRTVGHGAIFSNIIPIEVYFNSNTNKITFH